MYKVMTPGPTQVKENVRMARSLVCTNPDLDVYKRQTPFSVGFHVTHRNSPIFFLLFLKDFTSLSKGY